MFMIKFKFIDVSELKKKFIAGYKGDTQLCLIKVIQNFVWIYYNNHYF